LFLLIGATNQPDVARGTQRREVVEAMNARLLAATPIITILVCYEDGDNCPRRKPNPGLLLEAAETYGIDLAASFIVGDRWRDVKAGRRAGCRTVFVDLGYDERRPDPPADYTAADLPAAADWILSQTRTRDETMTDPADLKVKIFADGADHAGMLDLYRNPLIKGFTTNPTLMHVAGITDYEAFAREILQAIPDRPISLEVFSDDFAEMEAQGRRIASWGENVYVKIPVTNTRGESSIPLVRALARAGVKQNVTALMTLAQVRDVSAALGHGPSACVSVFAGRVADTGRDPVPIMATAVEMLAIYPQIELIWASPRELLNIFHADQVGCHIITVTHDLLKKLALVGKDLDEYSLDTVKMFRNDAVKAGFRLS